MLACIVAHDTWGKSHVRVSMPQRKFIMKTLVKEIQIRKLFFIKNFIFVYLVLALVLQIYMESDQ